ncbi:hypothetical protein TNCV_1665491 [Trichonephila clavipes]|nr:hypothetical protein TNCV_1665491 [Trichonephila clavipes]
MSSIPSSTEDPRVDGMRLVKSTMDQSPPVSVVWYSGEWNASPENRRVRFQCCRYHGDRSIDQLVTVLFPDEYFQRTEESVSNMAEIMEIKAWINRKINISDCIRLYGASDKLFHLRSKGRSHSSDASQRKKEDPGTTNLLVPHRGRCLGTRGEV